MKFSHPIAALLILMPGLSLGQDQSSGAWRFARATWGCSLNLAIREQSDAIDSFSNVELSYMIASTNPSVTFRIPENELTFSVNVRGYDDGDTIGLELSVDGNQVPLKDRQFANRLTLYTASADQAKYVFESMESGAQIMLLLRLSTGAELKKTLHDAGFADESRLFKECSSAI